MQDISAVSPQISPFRKCAAHGALLFFGVVLPIAALAVELTMRVSSELFFDPVPSVFHALLVALVAAVNCWSWFVLNDELTRHLRWVAVGNGVAIAVASFYSVLFLPLLPAATVGILFAGLGLAGWAPLASLIVALRFRVRFSRLAKQHGIGFRVWPGILAGFVAMLALELPSTMTRIGAHMATSPVAERQARGLRLLRAIGSEDVLLRMCYVRSGAPTDMFGFLLNLHRHVDPTTARHLYFRATGRAFNTVPAPMKTGRRGIFGDFRSFDADLGGDAVGGRVSDLWLAGSRIDGSVSAESALGYLEWTMVFRNDSAIAQEARAQIALPPGAVVSRVTLWIDGEEREAAFAGRRQVREAYEAVVRQSRDPVLVTSAGPDRVSVQLFPVPVAGEMKVRIGMTAPLALTKETEGVLRLPHFHERNFGIRESLRHSVWVESNSPLRSAAFSADAANTGTLRADLDDASLSDRKATIAASRADIGSVWAPDARDAGQVVRQSIGRNGASRGPRQLLIVVDGSASMQSVSDEIARVVAQIPSDVPVRLLFAHDAHENITSPLSAGEASKQLASFDYAGGHDNIGPLARGLDALFGQTDAVLLWIHGAQPVLLQTEEPIAQRLSRSPKLPKWYELQIAPGRNLVAEKLDGLASVETLRMDDFERLVSAWRAGEPRISVRRERVETPAADLPAAERTSDHLIRLWANDEIARLMQAGSENRAAAIALAQRYQLVTPVSGAVVLETQQQYDAAGLQPVAEGTVPTIPEPEEWALILIALAVLAYAYLRRRRALFAAHPA